MSFVLPAGQMSHPGLWGFLKVVFDKVVPLGTVGLVLRASFVQFDHLHDLLILEVLLGLFVLLPLPRQLYFQQVDNDLLVDARPFLEILPFGLKLVTGEGVHRFFVIDVLWTESIIIVQKIFIFVRLPKSPHFG